MRVIDFFLQVVTGQTVAPGCFVKVLVDFNIRANTASPQQSVSVTLPFSVLLFL
jgi:hypothetical protein